jgi:hypothetical protein
VDEFGVGADGDHFRTDLFEAIILLCQSSKFGRSDEGEVGGIEKQDDPSAFGFQLFQADRTEILPHRIIDFDLEGWDLLSDPETRNGFTHFLSSSRAGCLMPILWQSAGIGLIRGHHIMKWAEGIDDKRLTIDLNR